MQTIFDNLAVRKCIPEFVVKLYCILEDKENKDVIGWGDNSEVHIKDRSRLEGVLGACFRHSRTDSFVRQLNMYGFCKLAKKGNKVIFTNEHFKRGNIEGLLMIKRKRKGSDQEELTDLQKYKHFICSNLSILGQDLLRVKNSHPSVGPQISRIVSIIYNMNSKNTEATITPTDPILDRPSICSIENAFEG